jgi:hypothetical protein
VNSPPNGRLIVSKSKINPVEIQGALNYPVTTKK